MPSYQYIPHLATIFFLTIMSIFIIYLIRISHKESEDDTRFYKQLNKNLNPEMDEEKKRSFINEKLNILPEYMIKSGMVDKNKSISDIKRLLLLIFALIFTMGTFFLRNPFAGAVGVTFVYIGLRSISMFKISKVKNVMNEQIPAFVSTFKANIQANQHAQNAMIRAINNTASPLYDELVYAKSIMEAGDFRAGIIALRMNTKNDTLRQMASCIELASASGSNIEPQIEIIEEIIEAKQVMERKKKLGVNENKPLFIVAGLFVPISFFGSYSMSEMHRDFWFNSTLSWLIILGIVILTAISVFATWKIIEKVEVS